MFWLRSLKQFESYKFITIHSYTRQSLLALFLYTPGCYRCRAFHKRLAEGNLCTLELSALRSHVLNHSLMLHTGHNGKWLNSVKILGIVQTGGLVLDVIFSSLYLKREVSWWVCNSLHVCFSVFCYSCMTQPFCVCLSSVTLSVFSLWASTVPCLLIDYLPAALNSEDLIQTCVITRACRQWWMEEYLMGFEWWQVYLILSNKIGLWIWLQTLRIIMIATKHKFQN